MTKCIETTYSVETTDHDHHRSCATHMWRLYASYADAYEAAQAAERAIEVSGAKFARIVTTQYITAK